MNVFGDLAGKLASQWRENGGVRVFAEHVKQVVKKFDHLSTNADAWTGHTPRSSIPGHIVLGAVRRLEEQGAIQKGATRLAARGSRKALFEECVDISQHAALMELAGSAGLPIHRIERLVRSGEAHAAMAEYLELARQAGAHMRGAHDNPSDPACAPNSLVAR